MTAQDRIALKARRLALGLTLAQLALKIKSPSTGRQVRTMTVHELEKGLYSPSPVMLQRWVAALERLERKAK